jgi:hypothetical protein
MSRRLLPWAILVWTATSWGGRIGLLTDAESADAGSWARIGGSLAVGVLVWAALALDRLARPAAWLFAAWTAGVWGRSLVAVWTQPNSANFRLVHSVLAAVWFVLAILAVRHFGSPPAPDQAGSGTRSTSGAGPGGRISESRSTTSSTDR